MLCDDLNGKESPESGDVRIRMADSLCCTVETNKTLQSNYTPIKTNLLKEKNNNNTITDNNVPHPLYPFLSIDI